MKFIDLMLDKTHNLFDFHMNQVFMHFQDEIPTLKGWFLYK